MSVASNNTVTAIILGFMIPMIFVAVINVVFGVISLNMAKSRGLNPVPAFFAGFFGSVVTLFIIAMFPKRTY